VPENMGELAAALAKAQASFPTINRDKKVTVQTKTGGSYTFNYAPLEAIFAAVRRPLSENGLAVVQLLDDDFLVSSLMHSSGAVLSGRTPIPPTEGIQAFGSAITYLRRYALVALLGIATEEDDDGNSAAGNSATFGTREVRAKAPTHEATTDGGLIGIASIGDAPADYQLREEPEGWALSFKLMDGKKGFRVVARDDLAHALAPLERAVIGLRVTCWGRMGTASMTKGGQTINYNVLDLERIQTPEFTLPADGVDTTRPSVKPEAAGVASQEPTANPSAPDELDALPMFTETAA